MPAFLPWVLAALWGGARYVAGSLAVQLLIGLGVGFVTYQGMDVAFGYVKSQALSNLSGLPTQFLGLLAVLKIGEAISIITSAMTARLAMTTVRNAAGALVVKKFLKL